MTEIKNTKTVRGFLFLCLFLCSFFMAVTVRADDTRRTVRVAFPEQEGMSFMDADGACNGYNYEYLEKVSEYTGWKMEYVPYKDEDRSQAIQKAMDDVENGTVDLIGPILRNEATEKIYAFPENSYGTVYTTLSALENGELTENNLWEKENLRVGLLQQATTRNEEVIRFLESENLNYELQYYDDVEQQIVALQQNEVDLVSSVSLTPLSGSRIVEKFAARPYYFVTAKGNEDLLVELDDAMEKISQVNPYFRDELFEQYFRNDGVYFLTQHQVEYMMQGDPINVLCMDSDAPYTYQQNGEAKGMLVSVINQFAAGMNAEVTYSFCENRQEAEQMLQENDYDLLIGIPFTSEYCSQIGYIKSDVIMDSALANIERPDNTEEKTLAVVEGLEKYVTTEDYDKVILCENARECVKKVAKKEADIGFGDQSTLEYYAYEEGSDLVLNRLSETAQNVCIAIRKENDIRFAQLLNMYIDSMEDGMKSQYLADANVHTSAKSAKYYIKVYPAQSIAVICVLALLVTGSVFLFFYTRQMQKKNQELRMANEAKSEFLARMSHDIRTPMNGIMGMLDISDRMLDQPEQLKVYHQKIRTASEYLLSLINDVLDMSKLEAKEIRLTQESTDLVELIRSCEDILEARAAENGIVIDSTQIEEFCPPRVMASTMHLRQIFMNIVGNAVKYNKPNGKITVSAKILSQDADTVTCEFIVADTGVGMSEGFQKHMFEQFTQEEETARSEYNGTGLGLAIVKQIIDQMHGTIEVKSKKNEGSTFIWTLTFPVDREGKTEPTKEKTIGEVDLHGKQILVAEDNQLNAEIVSFLLEDWGAQVTLAENGKQAVEIFGKSEENTFSYILMDILMPVMDGHAASRAIRAMKRADAKTVPIIALSANAFAEDMEKSREAGMNCHITKPLDAEKLKKVLAKFERKEAN